jgi:hypothetical protein
MLNEGPNDRRCTAHKICKLKGLLDKDLDDVHFMEQWGTRLISAAVRGISNNDMELLLEAGSVQSQGEALETSGHNGHALSQALMRSSEFDHLHCIKKLVDSKADIHYRSDSSLYGCSKWAC